MDEHILRSRATGKSQRRDWEPREKGNEQEGSGPAEPVKPGHPPWGPWLVPEGGEHVSVEIVGVSYERRERQGERENLLTSSSVTVGIVHYEL